MNIIDLSYCIEPNMPVYPGTEPPVIKRANTIEQDGFAEKKITMYSHTGTHIDAPAHMLKEGPSLDDFDVSYFVGTAGVIDLYNIDLEVGITLNDLEKYEHYIEGLEYLILKTGWSKFWGTEEYFKGYPVLTIEAAEWLTERFSLRGLGVDTISVDKEDNNSFGVHYEFLKKGKIIIENLTNLDFLVNENFLFSCLPLKILEADGSPVRAIAILD